MALRTPVKAIRAKCLDCSNNNPYEVTQCPITDCPLHEYRSGHRPGWHAKRYARREGVNELKPSNEDFINENNSDGEV